MALRKIAVFALTFFLGLLFHFGYGQNTLIIDSLKPIPAATKANVVVEKAINGEILEQVKIVQGAQILDSRDLKLEKNVQNEKSILQQNTYLNSLSNPVSRVNNNNIINPESPLDTNRHIKIGKFELQKSDVDQNPSKGAAPGNDLICNAYVIPTDGTCYHFSEGNLDATPDYYGGCIPPNKNTIFFKFLITAPNDHIVATFNCSAGKKMETMLIGGTCNNPQFIESQCGFAPFTASYYNLAPGWYYLMFATQPGANLCGDFDICGTQSQTTPSTCITGPEQDCSGAIPVCDLIYDQTNSYCGYWHTQELSTGNGSCLLGGENNSVWYVFTPQTTGDIAFTITTLYDYDWAVYDLTAIGGCSAIPSATPVLCNYSATPGVTGATFPHDTIPRKEGATGSPTMPGFEITTGTLGHSFVLIIDNYTGDENGYILEFSAVPGTASIADRPGATLPTGAYPSMVSAVASCTSDTITIGMSELVQCITIRPSDFILTNTTTSTVFTSHIMYVTGQNCDVNTLTNQLIITHDGALTTGHYVISLNPAGVILADKCGNIIRAGGTVSFDYLADITLTATPASICPGSTISLNADGADGMVTYTLQPGGLTNNTNGVFSNLSPAFTTNYNVSATYGGCTKTATATVTVEGNIVTAISPVTKALCSATTTPITASTTINGVICPSCTYVWSTGQSINPITVGAGTYTVTATSPAGCHNSNSPSSNIYLASGGGGGACDVLYVSPAGGGDGLTKGSPTTLSDAITKAQCSNNIIKMQKGIYTLADYLPIHSYVTIEGGYDVGFTTKYSDMTGGANTTTIRRTNAGAVGTDCSAFVVDDNAELFRIQDMRIELPGSPNVAVHAASSSRTNYGIKLGTGCINYNIIRCYIDAGIGSAP